MHCLPVRRNVEIDGRGARRARSVVVDQAENRLHAQRALLLDLIGDPECSATSMTVAIGRRAGQGITGLKGALRYVRAYRDHVFVVKLGGEVLADAACARPGRGAARRCSARSSIRLVVVHGGGPQATRPEPAAGLEPRMVAGRRVTDDAALEVAKMVYRRHRSTPSCSRRCGATACRRWACAASMPTPHRGPPAAGARSPTMPA